MEILKRGSKGENVGLLQKMLNVAVDSIFGNKTELSVKDFQKNNGLKDDGVVGPKTWEKLNKTSNNTSSSSSLKRSKRNIKEIIVHCSATPEGKDYTVSQIKQWHKQRGFNDIGYHYVIYRDGSIHNGRDVDITGAHCTNHNATSIGICYIGGMDSNNKNPKDTRTPQQKASMLKLLKELKKLYPNAKIYGHRDFANKACPSFDATNEYKNI